MLRNQPTSFGVFSNVVLIFAAIMKELLSQYLEEKELGIYHLLSTIHSLVSKSTEGQKINSFGRKPDQSSHVAIYNFYST